MRLVKFEINDAESALMETLRESNDFYGDTPRLMFMKFIKKALAFHASTAPKEPPKKQSAAERKQENILSARAERRESQLSQFRSKAEWPRYTGQYMGHDHWKFPSFILSSTGLPGVTGEWTPPEDYPHFEEVGKMKAREEPEMTGRPKLEDFDGDEDAHFRAEMAWLKKDWTE